jgi:putative hemolysin
MLELIILFFLILLNAFIVMCEMALVSAKKSRLEATATKGDKNSQIALGL